MPLAKAREERDKCLDLLARGINPSLRQRLAKDAKTGQADDAFEPIAKEWMAKFVDTKSASHSKRVHARFDNDVFSLSSKPVASGPVNRIWFGDKGKEWQARKAGEFRRAIMLLSDVQLVI